LGYNLRTRNAKRLIDLDTSLVSIENLSEILLSSGWAQVRYQLPEMAKILPYLWCHSQKNPKPKKIFHCWLEDLCRVFWGFEQLSGTIGWGAMRLVSQLKYPCFFLNFLVQYICRPAANVLRYLHLPCFLDSHNIMAATLHGNC